ncbi:Tma17p Ecym_3356 [Eremothecium cymbalariae DBVPG|uniref:Uncharacterized protein n=1 Tax=Eremothecium cymbalariae (strain CBS 270.75 / DBVPG 7215 / KCTC 17166 / NRRL Y-17582) TaxID=931890 RepID=G8JRS5_ERECY|nr:Hypothetical protein Ecym_3356 [Eremothecium cymbalariae DBVPG\
MSSSGGGPSAAARPVQIDEFRTVIRDLSQQWLQRIMQEIENSVRHLQRSNDRLSRYITKLRGEQSQEQDELDREIAEDDIGQNDIQLFQDSLRENEVVLENYRERLKALDEEQLYRASGNIGGGAAMTKDVKSTLVPEFDSENADVNATAPNSVYL